MMECCLTGKICMAKLIDKALAELRYVFGFTSTANEFKEEKKWMEAKIQTLEQHAKVAAGNDKDIKADYHLWKEKAENLVQEDIQTKQKCFFGLCPDCIWRYKKGKELANNIEEIKQLTQKAENFGNIEVPRRLPDIERYFCKDYISFPSRESKYKELLDALKDENNYMIGLQGMGGIGKTTLAKKVGNELKISEQFTHVIVTTVSFTPDTKQIQDDIAGPLGLEWENCNDSNRPGKLWSRLTNGEKVLLILDDVWEQDPPLDFDLIGIPKKGSHNCCRVLITTRSKRISNIMECDKMIELDLLSEEEAWTMFKMYVGPFTESLISTGREIAKECKQLPVAIAVIARSLKGQQNRKHKWDATIKSLKEIVSMDDVDEEKVEIYKCLKSSYDRMKDEKAKGLFLLFSVFPEAKEISIEILTRLGIGTGLFGKNYKRYNDARDKVAVAIDKLIDSCLLVGVGEKHVKIHDLVREAAQWMAYKEIRHVNLSNKDEKSSVQKEKNMKYLFCEGKDMDLFSWKYDGSKLETLILDVERDEDRKCMEAPNSFIENIGQLQVLYFSGHDKLPLSLQDSLHSLANIRAILLDEVDLGDISVLGNLQCLETLDLVDCIIEELPDEIAKLGKFKLLNLERCVIKSKDPFEVIKGCSTLEELYFIRSFNGFCRDITFPELKRYRICRGETKINDSLSKYVSFQAVDGNECFFSKETFEYCMQTTEGLQLDGIKEGWKNLMPDIVPINLGMEDLVELRLKCISQLQRLIDTSGSQVPNILLSKLVVLELDTMENLVELFNGSFSLDFLKNLEELSIKNCRKFRRFFNCKLNLGNLKSVTLQNCPILVSLSPLLTSGNLALLEKLKIGNCEGLKNIITDEIGEEGSREEIDDSGKYNKSYVTMFPKLKVLDIDHCGLLESILPTSSFQDLPVLEVISVRFCGELKYICGQYQHVELSVLKEITLYEVPNFIGVFPRYSDSMSSLANVSSSTSTDGFKCNIFSGSMSTTKIPPAHDDPQQINSTASVSNSQCLQLLEPARCFPEQSHIMRNIKDITLHRLSEIKSLFILSTAPRMLETLTISYCYNLKHIIEDIGDFDNGDNNWGNIFPNLKELSITGCMELEYIFGYYTDDHQNHNEIHIHLPALQLLNLTNMPNFVAMCPKHYCITTPSLKEFMLRRCSLDNTIMKDLSGSIENFMALESLLVRESKAENILCLNEIEGQPLSLKTIDLYNLNYMMYLFVGPKNSFVLQNLGSISISRCEKLEVIFSTSILRCLSQLYELRIEDCKELKHIIEDDRQNQNLFSKTRFPKLKTLNVIKCPKLKCVFPVSICKELPELKALTINEVDELEEIFKSEGDQNLNLFSSTCFPKLKTLVVTKCHKLKYVFPVSTCKELPELLVLMMIEARELEEIFKSECDQKVEIPNLNILVLDDLPSLFHTQEILFQAAKNRFVRDCQNLSLTSVSIPFVICAIDRLYLDYSTADLLKSLFRQLQEESTTDATIGIEIEAVLGDEMISSQKLEKEQSTSQQGLKNQQNPIEEINTTIKPSQARNCVKKTNDQSIQEDYMSAKIVAATISEITNEPPKQLVSHKLKGVEEWAALRNANTITTSTNLELVGLSQEESYEVV